MLIWSWIQQELLLAHPQVRIFFTHGGKNSFVEAVENGKPVIILPLIQKDQNFFCEYAHMHHVGQCIADMTADAINKGLR